VRFERDFAIPLQSAVARWTWSNLARREQKSSATFVVAEIDEIWCCSGTLIQSGTDMGEFLPLDLPTERQRGLPGQQRLRGQLKCLSAVRYFIDDPRGE
jgi:hypothetical protein